MNGYTRIIDDARRQLDAFKVEIDALCAQAQVHIQQRYDADLEELRRRFRADRTA